MLTVGAAIRRNIPPSTIYPVTFHPVWIRHRRGRQHIGMILGDTACKHAPYHFDMMPHSSENGTRRGRRIHFGPENPVSQVGQSVVRKDFGFDIDAVRCPDAEPRIKSRDVGLNQRQRICHALLARTRPSGYLLKSRQQCDVSVHGDIRPSHFDKKGQRPGGFLEANDQCGRRRRVSKFLDSGRYP